MNQFELFCMIFFVLDAEWDETRDPELGKYLSSANPFLFADIGSADPSVFHRFCEHTDKITPLNSSFRTAFNYIQSLQDEALVRAFSGIEEKDWIASAREYLEQPHKGGEN